jgi:hypothetical protein
MHHDATNYRENQNALAPSTLPKPGSAGMARAYPPAAHIIASNSERASGGRVARIDAAQAEVTRYRELAERDPAYEPQLGLALYTSAGSPVTPNRSR